MSVIDNRGNEITHALRQLRGEEPSGRMFSWGGPGAVPAVLPPEHDFELTGDGACRHCGYTLIELEDGLISKICALKPPVGDVVFHGPDRRGRCYWRLADGLRFTGTREDYRRFVVERNAKAAQPARPEKPLTEPAPKTLLDFIRHATQAGSDLFGQRQLDNLQQTTGYMTAIAQERVRSAPSAQHQQHLAAHLAALAALREKNAAAVFNATPIARPADLGQKLIGERNAHAASPPSMLAVFADAMRTLDDSARLWSNPGFLAVDKALPDSETTTVWWSEAGDGNSQHVAQKLSVIDAAIMKKIVAMRADMADRSPVGVCADCQGRVPLSTMHQTRDGIDLCPDCGTDVPF